MKQIQSITALIAGLAFSLLLASCGTSNADESQEAGQTDAVTVRIKEVRPTPFADVIQVPGAIESYQDVQLSPEEGGVIREWVARKGQWVKKGDILCILNDDVIKATYDAALAQYKIAELNYEKQKNVYDENVISELQYKSAMYNRDAAKAQADLMAARLERTRVRSPINGILNERFREAGEYAPPAVPVAHVVNVGSIKVVTDVSERFAGTITVGDDATVIPDAFPEDSLKGRVIFVGSSVSSNNRTIPVEISIANPAGRLKPEMITRVRIVRSVRLDAIIVDQSLVQQVDRDKNVLYVEVNGKAEERIVTLGARQDNLVEITRGLQPGDHLIISGYQLLVAGQSVTIEQ
jgi:membrane fusion protein (multidrug efflux system)